MLWNQYGSDSAVLQSTAGTMSYTLSPNAFVASNRRAGGFDQSKKQQLALQSFTTVPAVLESSWKKS